MTTTERNTRPSIPTIPTVRVDRRESTLTGYKLMRPHQLMKEGSYTLMNVDRWIRPISETGSIHVLQTGFDITTILRRTFDITWDDASGTGELVVTAEADDDVEPRFQSLLEQWRTDTKWTSSATDICEHPAYQAIIAMGEPVVPLILREMARSPDHFDEALVRITGADPVPQESAGDLQAIAKAWLEWGKVHGYGS
jgi:hypothetical protein